MARSGPENARQRIGVFGGTFDPPHLGHVALVEAGTAELGLDRVLVIPTAIPPHRPTPVASPQLRWDLATLAFAELPGVEISDLELQDGGPTYTVDTLGVVAANDPDAELYLLLGADGLVHFSGWHRWRAIGELATVAVVGRPRLVSPEDLADAVTRLTADGLTVAEVPMAPVDISASQIRTCLAAGDWDTLATLVPQRVAHALREAADSPEAPHRAASGSSPFRYNRGI